MNSDHQHDHIIRFDIVKNRRKFFTFSVVLLLVGALITTIMGLNLSVDFKGGTRVDFKIGESFNTHDVEQIIKETVPDLSYKPISLIGTDTASTTFDETIPVEVLNQLEAALKAKYGDQVSRSESTVSPDIARELALKAGLALLIASLGIVVYIAFRFQFLFGIACVAGLIHDAFIPIAMFSLFRIEVDLTFIAAVLTIVGYSINDTIVIFDRIRENMRTMKTKTIEELEHMVNVSLWQTMRRSIFTVLTVVFGAVALAILGGEGIRNFSLALIFGLASGTYSSIFISAQLWVTFKEREMLKKKRYTPAPNEG